MPELPSKSVALGVETVFIHRDKISHVKFLRIETILRCFSSLWPLWAKESVQQGGVAGINCKRSLPTLWVRGVRVEAMFMPWFVPLQLHTAFFKAEPPLKYVKVMWQRLRNALRLTNANVSAGWCHNGKMNDSTDLGECSQPLPSSGNSLARRLRWILWSRGR